MKAGTIILTAILIHAFSSQNPAAAQASIENLTDCCSSEHHVADCKECGHLAPTFCYDDDNACQPGRYCNPTSNWCTGSKLKPSDGKCCTAENREANCKECGKFESHWCLNSDDCKEGTRVCSSTNWCENTP